MMNSSVSTIDVFVIFIHRSHGRRNTADRYVHKI